MPRQIKDRVVEMRRIDSAELIRHPLNPRGHPSEQKAAMRGILEEVGMADTLVVYRSEREGGKYVIIDGHLRAEDFPNEWPCVVVDLNDAEADLLIQAHDAVGQLAVTDVSKLRELREQDEFQDAAVRHMLDMLEPVDPEEKGGVVARKDEPNKVPDMELKPYEHYDYVLVLARNTFDWNKLCNYLEIRRVAATNDNRYRPKIGLGRAIPADRLLEMFVQREELERENERLRREVERLGGSVPQVKGGRPVKGKAGDAVQTDEDLMRARNDF